MELFNNRSAEITKLAMDGLLDRQKAVSSNTANAMTPEYQRKDVAFEDQLREIISQDEVRRDIRMQNSLSYNPASANAVQKLSQEHALFLQQTNFSQDFKPEVLRDYSQIDYGNGNNVNIEEEMMDMAKVGSQYTILTSLQNKHFSKISSIIKGTGA